MEQGLSTCGCGRLTANRGRTCTSCMDGRPVLFKVRGRLKSANDPRRKHSPEFVADVLRTYARAPSGTSARGRRRGPPRSWASRSAR
jgi:hypothetical protein